MKRIVTASLLALGLAAAPASADTGIKLGMLTCDVSGGIGYIVGSSKKIDCTYEPAGSAKAEHYEGRIGKLGIDIGVTQQATVAWAVFAPGKVKKGALAGSYAGASAEATVIGGLGANVLVGGFNKSINLQPVSLQAQTGINVAAGIASLRLEFVR
jgi:hypothetical protein